MNQPPTTEPYSIYHEESQRIRTSGYGPPGMRALLISHPGALQDGEKVAPFASNPNAQKVVTGPDGRPALETL